MSTKSAQHRSNVLRLRALRRARRYIRANQGALARVLNTYAQTVKSDPSQRFWSRYMSARPQKHSLTLKGHRTSVSLEAEFWSAFREIAASEGKPVNALASEIDAARGPRCRVSLGNSRFCSGAVQKQLTRIIHRRWFFGWRTWHKRLNSCMNLLLYSFTTTPTEFPARHARRYPDPARSVTGR